MLEFKLKNTIGQGRKMFWKYQLAINTEFLLAFYKNNSQMRVFWSHCRALLVYNVVLHAHKHTCTLS